MPAADDSGTPARSTETCARRWPSSRPGWPSWPATSQLDATLLATRGDLEALLRGDADARLAEGWRAEIVGEPIRRLVGGEAAVAFAGNGELVIEERSHRSLT